MCGTPVQALVDTGATVSCVDQRVVPYSALIPCPYVALQSANNSHLRVLGTTQVTFSVHSTTLVHSFYVIDKLLEPMILGMDFLSAHHARLDCVKKTFTIEAVSLSVHPQQSSSTQLSLEAPHLAPSTDVMSSPLEALTALFPDVAEFRAGSARIQPITIRIQPGTSPIKQNVRQKAIAEKEVIDREVQKMLELGVIRHSASPWASPVHLVPKGDGEIRFCIDFRRVNSIVVADAYPMPFIQDLVDALDGAKVFSTLDLAKGYWQVPLDEASKEITAFATVDGLYEFNVLPFGLCTASAIFQRTMHRVFGHLPFVRIYMDDLVVFSSSEKEHKEHLLRVFECLHQAGMAVNLKKCQLFQQEVKFLGVTVGREGVRPNNEKIDPILKMSPPKDKKGVQEFLGLVNFYRDFCPRLAERAKPLYDLLKKVSPFIWEQEQENAFNDIKTTLTSPPLLQIARRGHPFVVSTDASATALGAVLAQVIDGRELPIAYASRTLTDVETRYAVIEKELLAIVFAVKRFRSYLFGTEFTVYSDHNPLQGVASLKDPHGRLARWNMFLQGFHFQVKYRPGKHNGNADALTRCGAISAAADDVDYNRILNGERVDSDSEYHRIQEDLVAEGGAVWITSGNCRRRVIPRHMRDDVLLETHQLGHFGIKKTFNLLRIMFWWPQMYRDVSQFVRGCQICQHRKCPIPAPQTTASFTTTFPLELVCWDLMGPLPVSRRGNKYILVIIDAFSRWTVAVPLIETSADTLAHSLWTEFVSRYGAPRRIHSDRGRNLNAEVIKRMLTLWGIKSSSSAPYFPQGNGIVERVNKTLQDVVAKHLHEKDSTMWDEALPVATFAINTAPHCETGESPHSLFFGRLPRLPVALSDPTPCVLAEDERFHTFRRIYESTKDNMQRLQRDHHYKPGDLVLVYRPAVASGCPKKFAMPWKGPFPIIRQSGFMKYILKDGASEFVAHQTQLKRYVSREIAGLPTSHTSSVETSPPDSHEPSPAAASETPSRHNQRYEFRPRIFKPTRVFHTLK